MDNYNCNVSAVCSQWVNDWHSMINPSTTPCIIIHYNNARIQNTIWAVMIILHQYRYHIISFGSIPPTPDTTAFLHRNFAKLIRHLHFQDIQKLRTQIKRDSLPLYLMCKFSWKFMKISKKFGIVRFWRFLLFTLPKPVNCHTCCQCCDLLDNV